MTTHETLDFIEKSGAALAAAQDAIQEAAAEQEKAAEIAPKLVGSLRTAQLLGESEKTAAQKKLSSHTGALEVISNLIDIYTQTKTAYEQKLAVGGNGSAMPAEKQAAAKESSFSSGGFVGARRGAGQRSAADAAFYSQLGLATDF